MPSVTASPTIITTTPNQGIVDFVNPSNVTTEDGVFAVVSSYSPLAQDLPIFSYDLRATGFDFSNVPNGSNITAITYGLKRKSSDVSGSNYTLAYTIEGGVIAHSFPVVQPVWGTSLAYESDTLVANVPTAAVVKASNFGVVVKVQFYGGDGVTVIDAFLDHVRLTVFYNDGNPDAGLLGSIDCIPSPVALGRIASAPQLTGTISVSKQLQGRIEVNRMAL